MGGAELVTMGLDDSSEEFYYKGDEKWGSTSERCRIKGGLFFKHGRM